MIQSDSSWFHSSFLVLPVHSLFDFLLIFLRRNESGGPSGAKKTALDIERGIERKRGLK
jgi:hypothetical protein